jgi:hypothetical protein
MNGLRVERGLVSFGWDGEKVAGERGTRDYSGVIWVTMMPIASHARHEYVQEVFLGLKRELGSGDECLNLLKCSDYINL